MIRKMLSVCFSLAAVATLALGLGVSTPAPGGNPNCDAPATVSGGVATHCCHISCKGGYMETCCRDNERCVCWCAGPAQVPICNCQ